MKEGWKMAICPLEEHFIILLSKYQVQVYKEPTLLSLTSLNHMKLYGSVKIFCTE